MQRLARRVLALRDRDNLCIHAGAAVLQREVGPPLADPAARGKRSVERDVVGVGLPQDS